MERLIQAAGASEGLRNLDKGLGTRASENFEGFVQTMLIFGGNLQGFVL